MNLEDQIKEYKTLCLQIDELEKKKKALSEQILQQMKSKKMEFGELIVQRYDGLSIKLTIDEARTYQATNFKEVIDRAKIKALFEEGKILEGVSKNPYLVVSNKKN